MFDCELHTEFTGLQKVIKSHRAILLKLGCSQIFASLDHLGNHRWLGCRVIKFSFLLRLFLSLHKLYKALDLGVTKEIILFDGQKELITVKGILLLNSIGDFAILKG